MNKLLFRLFIKDHENTADPAVRMRYGRLAGVVGILSNLLLCIMKICVGYITKSIAIMADGVNNLTDASSSIITLIGFKLSSLPEDEKHPYGHARIEYLTGLFISIMIIVIGVQLLRVSVEKILTPDPVSFSYITVILLIASILVKLWQAAFNSAAGRRIDSVALLATAADSRNDVISTSAVLASLLIGEFTGLQTDGWMGCLVVLFILWSGIRLVRETISPLLGEAPDEELVREIIRLTEREPGILGIHDLIVHNYGPGKVFASMHIEVDADGDLMKSHDMIDNVERLVKETLHIEFVVHMDPVRTDDPVIRQMRQVMTDALSAFDGVDSIHDFRIVTGPTHANIIFDVVLSADCKAAEKEILATATAAARKVNENYFVVITFDRTYTPLPK